MARLETAVIEGNPFVGLFACCNEQHALVPVNAPEKFVRKCESALGAEVHKLQVAGSNLLGIFCVVNSNGILLPRTVVSDEVEKLKSLGLNPCVLKGKLSAVGNNVLANDHGAIVNPDMSQADFEIVADCLGVEVVKREIAGFKTVGSAALATNKGVLVHNNADDEEVEEVCDILGVKSGAIGTANMGTPFVGLCLLANTKGYVAGMKTSGFELSRIDEALGFI